MATNSLVSVIIPCYNAEKYIAETLQSVLQQTYPTLEVIVVDDGSKDTSAAIVAAVSAREPRVRLHAKPNSGVADSRNVGIGLAQGEYIAFLDADDLFEPDNLARKVDYLAQHQAIGLVHSAETRFRSETGQTVEVIQGRGGQVLPLLLGMSTTVIHSPSSVVVRRQVLDQAGHFDTKLSTSADWELWVRLARETEFGYLPQTLVRYRIHGQQMHNNIPLMERDMVYAFDKLHRQGSYFVSESYYQQCLANLYLILAACYRGDMHDNKRFLYFLAKSVVTDIKPLWWRLWRRNKLA